MEQRPDLTLRYIAFLRAINVGGHTVKMDTLRKYFEGLGFSKVETFIASGNVIFEAPNQAPGEVSGDLEKQVENHLRACLGYEVATFIRTPAEVDAIARYRPFPALGERETYHGLYVAFLASPPPEDAAARLQALRTPQDDFYVCRREVYWLCYTRVSDSPFSGAILEKTLRMPATIRNITTVQKLASKYHER